jgi:hypothetical protein
MSRMPLIKKLLCIGVINSLGATTAIATPQDLRDRPPGTSPRIESVPAKQAEYREINLDFSALQDIRHATSSEALVQLKLPLPEGGETEFNLSDSGTLPPELAQRYPHIRSMKGSDAHGRQLRLDISENGVHAIVFDPDGTWLVQPEKTGGGSSAGSHKYVSFRENAKPAWPASSYKDLSQESINKTVLSAQGSVKNHGQPPGNDNSLRDYRIAIATTSAYSTYFGGTVSASLASVVEAINRVNAVYERDLGIHLTLVKDNDKLIFTDPATDPYIGPSEDSPDWDLDFTKKQNQKVVTKIIGKDNFDVGHLFELSEGGSADSDSVCQDENKANASNGLIVSLSDSASMLNKDFIDGLVHEIGHQFGANHTMNGCERSSEEAKSAFEPGSGSTIMSYGGECPIWNGSEAVNNPLHNLQNYKDSYFHSKSIEQVRAFVSTAGAGAKCGTRRNNPNTAPSIVAPYKDVVPVIPARTPFSLTGSAQSKNPNAHLTYTWEQIDLGPEQKPDEGLSDKGHGPIFRSFTPTPHGTRIFPKLEVILGDEKTGLGEVYPTTTRELNFRLTVRDNLGAHASTSYVDRKIQVLDTGQAFGVTYPTHIAKWKGRSRQSVSWNVAGTERAPISCKNVRLDLSVDGGHSYLAQPLAASTPNTGNAQVFVPAVAQDTSEARIRVSCNSNVFFALSPGNFTIRK